MIEHIIYLVIAISIIGMIGTTRRLFLAMGSKSWIKTSAKVIKADIGTGWTRDQGRKYYKPTIRYAYTFGSQTYESDNFNFRDEEFSEDGANIRISLYYPGKEIDVFVNPMKPEIAVIKSGLNGWHVFNVVVCIVMFAGAVLFLTLGKSGAL